MSSLCLACNDPLPEDNDYVHCKNNGCKLHYECAGMKEKTYRTMGQQRRDTYKCRLCRNTGDNISSDNDSSDSVQVAIESSKKSGPITMEGVIARLDLFEKSVKFNLDKNTREVKHEIAELRTAVDFCSNKIDDFVQELAAVNRRVLEVEKANKYLAEQNVFLESKLHTLELEVQEIQQYGRRCNLQLDGVPEVEGERIMDIVNQLAIAVDEPVTLNIDVQAAHRIPTKNTSRPRPVVVQFSNRQKRDAVMKKAKVKKIKSTDFVVSAPETFVYVNDHLTPYYKRLLFEAKKAKLAKKYAFLWVRGSKIFMRKDKDSNAIRLDSMKDIEKL